MNNEWDLLLGKVISKKSDKLSWISDRNSLVEIIVWSKAAGLDPTGVSKIHNTKLRTIVKEAKLAIAQNNLFRIKELFSWAKTMTIIDLRHKVGISKTEEIVVVSSEKNGRPSYSINLTKEQYDRITKSTRSNYQFVVLPKPK